MQVHHDEALNRESEHKDTGKVYWKDAGLILSWAKWRMGNSAVFLDNHRLSSDREGRTAHCASLCQQRTWKPPDDYTTWMCSQRKHPARCKWQLLWYKMPLDPLTCKQKENEHDRSSCKVWQRDQKQEEREVINTVLKFWFEAAPFAASCNNHFHFMG